MIIKEYLTHKPLNSTVELSRPEVCRFAPVLFGAEPNAFASLLLRPQLSQCRSLAGAARGVFSSFISNPQARCFAGQWLEATGGNAFVWFDTFLP